MQVFWRIVLLFLCVIFCIAYPIAVIGVAFDVNPPFSMTWAGSALLFLEGGMLILAAIVLYGPLRALLMGGLVVLLSYGVEALGVLTGWPFGIYHYTHQLVPLLPGGVPLPVMFAWILVIFGGYSWVVTTQQQRQGSGRRGWQRALQAALLAMLLDLAIEPVATYVVHYWVWADAGRYSYYGVPLTNFIAWFVVALLFLVLADRLLGSLPVAAVQDEDPIFSRKMGSERLALFVSRVIFVGSLIMFGLVNLTHGFFGAAGMAALAGVLLLWYLFNQQSSEIVTKKLHE
ncbi:carotenoid biosynthesis protein [Tengunoibacter tsumagoiensis]|uniref:Carotenoid biosynthesis protein n=1 Tax=Tengunoibacter tsumagoiensis TaxID=2014871 RepID=A0A402A4S8_9CHLR|nr:carotenoid biosynthesis protein [Tengunoibacter tsumagoiensis]GCE14011.1 hypothetical protein KTT_38700 [Tengunoibacter tsumagoiensis]